MKRLVTPGLSAGPVRLRMTIVRFPCSGEDFHTRNKLISNRHEVKRERTYALCMCNPSHMSAPRNQVEGA